MISYCEYCGDKLNDPTHTFCENCGKRIETQTDFPPRLSEDITGYKCRSCGREISEKANYLHGKCPECHNKDLWKWITATFLVILIPIILFIPW